MSFFSVFDSKGREFVLPKASPTHNKYQNHKFKIFQAYKWFWLWEIIKIGENPTLGDGPRKRGSGLYTRGQMARAR
jgi:hypothetical protein